MAAGSVPIIAILLPIWEQVQHSKSCCQEKKAQFRVIASFEGIERAVGVVQSADMKWFGTILYRNWMIWQRKPAEREVWYRTAGLASPTLVGTGKTGL